MNVSSEGEHSEEAIKGVKKTRLGGSRTTQEPSLELAEEIVGIEDHTKGLKEEDEILRALSVIYEEVKKPSLGESSETNEENDNTEILEVEDARTKLIFLRILKMR